jgi:hypothetical protein
VPAFLSYSHANRAFADKLREELARLGMNIWTDNGEPGASWPERLKEAIKSASDLLLVIGPRDGRDEDQAFTWQLVLEAAWSDKSKRLIPILLKDTPLPPFVLSAFKLSSMDGADLPIVRVRDPQRAAEAAKAVVRVARGKIERGVRRSRRWSSRATEIHEIGPIGPRGGYDWVEGASPYRLSVSLESSSEADASTKLGYSIRLDEVERLAKSLKH